MKSYLELLERVIATGKPRTDRTGTGTLSTFGEQLKIDLSKGFPLLTTKKMFFRGVMVELLWFLRGRTDVGFLQEKGVHIWDEWADKETGELGPIYGHQWRNWSRFTNMGEHFMYDREGIDQLKQLVDGIWDDPYGRRHIVTAWNPADLPKMALPPCHILFQCYVSQTVNQTPRNPLGTMENKLSLHLYARSIDIFLGLPFNIASYALLLSILAAQVDMLPDQLVISFGDLHLYKNHTVQAATQLKREPKKLPWLELSPNVGKLPLDTINESQIGLLGYDYHPAIAAPIAV